MVEPQTTYKIDTICKNCGYDGLIELAKGLLVDDALMVATCPTCGCNTLDRKNKELPVYDRPYNPLKQKKYPNPFSPFTPAGPAYTNKPRILQYDNKTARISNDNNINRTSFSIGQTKLSRSISSVF